MEGPASVRIPADPRVATLLIRIIALRLEDLLVEASSVFARSARQRDSLSSALKSLAVGRSPADIVRHIFFLYLVQLYSNITHRDSQGISQSSSESEQAWDDLLDLEAFVISPTSSPLPVQDDTAQALVAAALAELLA